MTTPTHAARRAFHDTPGPLVGNITPLQISCDPKEEFSRETEARPSDGRSANTL